MGAAVKEEHRNALHEKAATFPTTPGVYLMKDAKGIVLYIGKGKSLRSRVTSYVC